MSPDIAKRSLSSKITTGRETLCVSLVKTTFLGSVRGEGGGQQPATKMNVLIIGNRLTLLGPWIPILTL